MGCVGGFKVCVSLQQLVAFSRLANDGFHDEILKVRL